MVIYHRVAYTYIYFPILVLSNEGESLVGRKEAPTHNFDTL